ncbi:hypothetical protein [Pseudobacter ginsenosidimutans]|uniref:Cro/C1-type helix-turn-helix DNA-binding protein n=1 Tax=Pseudobacter ginsenosidimutans TaxID=661488 RepID=A0A4Q7N5K5_9BACT|nr:hypothetical protein [Pseudobacter ginsenosidimutans]QEC44819.1 hypothetical protein FSB84_25220 [Pseudobacter ginsenosidimutans]RZS76309.1 hypothetical protein EV199_2190 [Pseudobacter ginsenosidimutans]
MADQDAYKTLKRLLESGSIEDMDEIVSIVGKTKLKTTVGIHYDTFLKRVKKPEDFAIKHIKRLADLIGVDPRIVTNLIFDKMEKKSKRK